MYNALSRASVVIQLQQDVEQYEAAVVSTNGVILQPYDTSTTLIGSVLKNKKDITDKIKDIRWTKWNPSEDNLIECPDWNRTHNGSHIIEVSKEDVDSKSIFTFEAYNTKGELLCTASISIIDINDLLVNTEKPSNPYPGQLWIDEETEPATLYVWNGYKWVIVGSIGTVVKNLLRNTSFLFNTDFWGIVGDTRLSFAPYGVDYLGHRFLKMASDVLTDERRGISQTTEDIIGTGAEYSFQMLYYSKEDTQTYSNNIKVNVYSVNSHGDEALITTKTVQAKADIKRLFFVFKTRLDTKDIKVEILGEEGHRYNFFVGEIALYNTANDYPWTMHPLDLQLYGYTQEKLWNILSNNGKIQGIFTRTNPETGQLEYYINASYIGAGKMKAEYLDAYNLRVLRKDDDITTLEITENGDVNLRVNTLVINSANKTIEDIVSQIYVDQGKIELKVDNYKEELSSSITQTAAEIRLEVKNTKEELESNISQTAKEIRSEVKNNKEELESSISQTAKDIRLEVKNNKEELESSITQTAKDIRLEVKNAKEELESNITQTAKDIRLEVKNTKEELESNITQTAKEINLKVSDNANNISSLIGITADGVYLDSNGSLVDINGKGVTIKTTDITLDASSIHLEGYTTINQGFSIDKEGNMTAKDGKFSGTITGSTIEGGSIGIGGTEYDAFIVDSDGNCKITKGSITIGDKFSVGTDGVLTATDAHFTGSIDAGSSITGTDISGGTITGTTIRNESSTFFIDENGNISGGSITIGNNFKVTSDGKLTAKSANFTGNINSGSTITGSTIKNASNTFSISEDGAIKGGSIGIGGSKYDAFTVDNNGNCKITKGSISIGGNFVVGTNGILTATGANFTGSINAGSSITGTNISGGTITGTTIKNTNNTFSIDDNGHISGGSITIGDNFKVTSDGKLTAKSASFTGNINSGSTITGATIKNSSGTFQVDANGNIKGAAITGSSISGTSVSGGTITGATIQNSSGSFKVDANGNVKGAAISGSSVSGGTITGTTISGGSLSIGDNFSVNTSGVLTAKEANITGTITSTDGNIGGYTIGEHKLTATNVGMCSNSSVEWAFWAGANAGADAPFHVGHDGSLYATKATITGDITATSGSFTGTITAEQGEIGGFTIGQTTLKGTNVGLCSSTGEWAFWAGASTGGDSAFHVGHDGKLYSSSANISGTISSSTITASSFSDPNNFFIVDSDGTVTAQSINIEGEVSAEKVVGEYLAIPWYSKSLTKNVTCYIRPDYTYPEDENKILEDGIFTSFDDLQDYMPRNLNGYTLTVNFESDVTDQLNIDNFCNGTVRIAFNGNTLKGNIRAIGRSLEILIYGNKPGSTKGSTRGKIVPGKNGYLYNNYTYCIVGDKCRITVYDIDLYSGTTATSSDMIGNNGICCTNGAIGYLSAIKAINEPYALVRCHSVSHVYVESSSGRSKDCTFQAISGSIMHLNDTTQAGTTGSKGTTYTKDNAKIFADGVKYDSGSAPIVDPTPVEPPKNDTITVTKTIKSTAGRTWRTSGNYANSWSTESIVRQGQWTTGNGKNKGYWFFGNDIYNILQNSNNTVTSMTVKITRNSGGVNAAVTHYLRAHTISSKPSGSPSDYLGTSTLNKKFSLAVGNSITLTLSSTEISNLKSSKAKGFGLYNSDFTTGKNGSYSCCSSSCTVTIKYKTTES